MSAASGNAHGAALGKKHNKAKATAKALAACKLGIAPEFAMGTSCRTVSSGKTKQGRMRANQGFSSCEPRASVVARARAMANRGLHAPNRQCQTNPHATTPRQKTAIHREDKDTHNNSKGRPPQWLTAKKISSSRGKR